MLFNLNPMFLKRIIPVLLSVCLPALLSAQQAAEPVSVRLSALSLGSTLNDLKFQEGRSVRDLIVPNASRSPTFQYSGPPVLEFFTEGEIVDGERVRDVVASVDLTGKTGQWVLVFLPKPPNAERVPVLAIEDGFSDFPAASWRVYNLTPFSMALQVDDDRPVMIQSGAQHTLRRPVNGNRTERVQVALYREDSWELAYRSFWSRREHARALYFLTQSGSGEGIVVRRFSQALRDNR